MSIESGYSSSIAQLTHDASLPTEKSLIRSEGGNLHDRAEAWFASRFFSQRKMAKIQNVALRAGATGKQVCVELGRTARKMIEASLKLSDSAESV